MSDELALLVERTIDRAGHAEREVVEAVVHATLRELGWNLGGLPPALHDVVPAELREVLAAGAEEGEEQHLPLRPAELYAELGERLGMRPGVALELVQSTLAELGERLGGTGRERLREHLPPAWAVLVTRPRARSRPVRSASAPGEGRTLATGKPGATRTLADADLHAGQTNSIATSEEPHRERLASAHGPGPQRDEGTLATGRPGSSRSVSG